LATLGTTVLNQRSRTAVALGAIAFALYVAALPPAFAFWDTGELQTVAVILGIAHPPACPAFVLFGWLVAHVVPFGEPAWRVDLMCAASMGVAVGALYQIARRFGVPAMLAAVCTLGFAFASVTLRDATRAEVQDLSLAARALALLFALRFYDTGSHRALAAAAFVLGLAGATHGIALLLVPSLVLLLVARSRGRRPRVLALAAGCIALGLLPYAYLPLRSAYIVAHGLDPTVALGLPAGSSAFWDYDHPATLAGFVRVLSAADFNVHSGFTGFLQIDRYATFAAALWRRIGSAYGLGGALIATLGFVGFVVTRCPDRLALVLAALLPVPYTESYAELQDPDRYYLFTLWCAAIAIGFACEAGAAFLVARRAHVVRAVCALGLIVSFAAPAPARFGILAQRDDRGASDYVETIEMLVPDGAIVLADWAYATPLAYASYVRRNFGGRIVVAASPQQYVAYYPAWLRTREIYVVSFNEALALPGYRCTTLKRSSYSVYRITRT